MSKISLDLIQKLRERTSMGMMDCKKALEQAEGDMDKAVELLRKKGASVAAKRGDNATDHGIVHAYIHPGATVGVLLEMNCETDFVASSDVVKQFAQDLGLHIAALNPLFLSPEEVDTNYLEKEKQLIKEQLEEQGKKGEFVEKILEGKIAKIYSEVCLLQQKFVKNDKLSVDEALKELIAKVGENIKIRRFARYQIGV
ncbi:translation elongation factor Ts [bacterium]|nr:translation elongation factor Ts [bacterium]